MARLNPEQIDYINAHASSTKANDAVEVRAVKTVFGEHAYKIPVTGTKGYHGHALGATGCFEASACCLALERGFISADPAPGQSGPGMRFAAPSERGSRDAAALHFEQLLRLRRHQLQPSCWESLRSGGGSHARGRNLRPHHRRRRPGRRGERPVDRPRGARVLVLERAVFPRDKVCGDCLNPECWDVFDRLGLAARSARSAALQAGARFVCESGRTDGGVRDGRIRARRNRRAPALSRRVVTENRDARGRAGHPKCRGDNAGA